ncbi:S1C family serine protease [Pyxidicoccus xibeiensis]|uniref:S1C family serine protease n=1 Tax=Pyxidicoccus xibeiensis TaxID=2906759 RepID=UPI0020A73902|nr:S1C family serine protease [Pyxidicoccus xibeiensis]MCP3140757.1 S1C family serine protease [Pyxidicoccus xibeiensis]
MKPAAYLLAVMVAAALPRLVRAEGTTSPPSAVHTEASVALPDLVKVAGRAVVSLQTYDAQGTQLGLGSGFLVEKGRVVTNAHVLEGAARVEVYDFEDNLLGTADYAESLSSRIDLAVLPAMPNTPGALRLAASEPPVGESIIVIGAPQGLTNTVSTGIVSAFRDHEGKRWMQISAPISQGSSGGPVLNQQGEVVGVSVAVLRDGQNLNFAVPGRNVRALLGSPPGRIALSSYSGGAATPKKSVASSSAETKPVPKKNFREVLLGQPRLTLGQPLDDELNESDTPLESGKRVDVFTVEGRVGDVYTVFVVSKSFDATLLAIGVGSDGEPESIGHDDDGAGGTDPRLVIRLKRTGIFGLMVSSVRAGEVGAYRIGIFKGDVSLPKNDESKEQSRWVAVARGAGFTVLLDKTTIRKLSSARRQAWEWTVYTGWQSGVGGRYNSVKALNEYDCPGRATRYVSIAHYADDEVVNSNAYANKWLPWTPGSVGEMAGEAVCVR